MLDIDIDQTTVATTIIGNITLQLAIQIQRYAKRQIINLALHGFSTDHQENLWQGGTTLLIVAECFFYLMFGLGRDSQMLPMGVFTIMANTVLPPLYFESSNHAATGALLSQAGILLIILVTPATEVSAIVLSGIDLDSVVTRYCICSQLIIGLGFCAIRGYKPENCSLKLVANCGLSSLMGSYTVAVIESVATGVIKPSTAMGLVGILLVLESSLLIESLKIFPVWQVVPHQFSLFVTFISLNKVLVFHQLDYLSVATKIMLGIGYTLLIAGVWSAAKPHLDIPPDIQRTGMMPVLEQRVIESWQNGHIHSNTANLNETFTPGNSYWSALCTQYGHSCLRNEYCQMMHNHEIHNH